MVSSIESIFNEFIAVIKENKDYTIGLLDKTGTVVFCSVPLNEKTNFESRIDDDLNRFFEIKTPNPSIQYLWVKGPTSSLPVVSNLLFESLVTRLRYENNQEQLTQKVSLDDKLIKELLDVDNFNLKKVKDMMHSLQLDTHLSRTAILVIPQVSFDTNTILKLKAREEKQQVILSFLDEQKLLIFKDESNKEKSIHHYIKELIDWGIGEAKFYIGSSQYELKDYVLSYQRALWLSTHLEDATLINDFKDYRLNYLLPDPNTELAYMIVNKSLDDLSLEDLSEMEEISNALFGQNFNLTKAAEVLFIHKNTLIYRIKKIEKILDLKIRDSFQDKVLFYYYIQLIQNFKRKGGR